MSKSSDKSLELSNRDELVLEKNLVWIFGSTRSGTTWLGKELLSYHTYVMDEPRINLHLGIKASGLPIGVTEMDRSKDRDDYFFSLIYKNSWNFYLRKLILNRIFSQFQDITKKIIIKEPTAGEIGNITIAECLPNSKILWLLRDGRDVVDSQLDALEHGFSKGGRFEKHSRIELNPGKKIDFAKNRSTLWVKIMEKIGYAFENHNPSLKLLVRYENLRKNTFEELQKIYKFVGIEIGKKEIETIIERYSFENIPKDEKGAGKAKRSATPGRWKNNFNEEEKKIMNSIMENTLVRLQYEI